ncbi:MAG TPA: lasso peptide biosynthesis B2 protein, partial [Steroidobacteraceae bacterium]|nr:lasso peptide biosynthesis B2 protein [Steroidobacteraceae bacterium]
DVFARATDEGTVFLDLKRDRYFGIDAAQTRLYRLLEEQVAGSEAAQLAARLSDLGLLRQCAVPVRSLLPPPIDKPRESLLSSSFEEPPRVRIGHWMAFGAACTSVALALKLGSLRHAVRRFQRLRSLSSSSTDFDAERTRTLVRIFRHLRPAAYAARDNCLYDSLVLGDFLCRHGIHSQCVFGVRMTPFEAHCWVQSHGFILNGSVEIVGCYSPLATF